jgi:hypothetical protein
MRLRSRGRAALVVLAAALLAAAILSPGALAGKKKKTAVVVESTTGVQNVKVLGHLNSAPACELGRSLRLFVTDVNGVVTQGPLDIVTSGVNGDFRLQGRLSAPATDSDYLQVKAKKRVVGKFVCRAGFSPLIKIRP